MKRDTSIHRILTVVALALILQQPLAALAQGDGEQEARLAPGDEIAVTVPGRPELDRTLTLDASGRVAMEHVGEVRLSGLTLDEANTVLRQRMRLFYPDVDVLEVDLRSASHVVVYILGGVRTPGSYDFATEPTVWQLVRAAGGPSSDAQLRASRIVRTADGSTSVIPVDLSGVLEGRGMPETTLRHGDTLVIPTSEEEASIGVSGSEAVQVFGGVNEPTLVPLDGPTELMEVLMRAGAPETTADLGEVFWVHRTGGGFVSRHVDMRLFLEQGDPAGNPLIHPGDTIEVGIQSPSWWTRNLPLILGVLATAATVVLAWHTVSTN